MSTIIPRIGDPVAEARYVVFVETSPARGWVEPIIAAWHGGRWHVEHGRAVYGWIGPLPVLKTGFFRGDPVQSFSTEMTTLAQAIGGTPIAEYDL